MSGNAAALYKLINQDLEKLKNQNSPKEVINAILELYNNGKFEEIKYKFQGTAPNALQDSRGIFCGIFALISKNIPYPSEYDKI